MSGSLRDNRIRVFLAAEMVSAIGTWATIVAIWGYAAYEFNASPGEVALFGIAFTLPPVLLSPLTGAAVDRLGPKGTLAGAKVLGALASLALLAADDFRTFALLSALHGASGAFALPALQALPPRIVRQDQLARTNALVSLADEVAIVFGPVLAGAAIAAFGFRGAFVIDAGTYLLGLVVLPLIQVRPVEGPAEDEGSPIRQALQGWRAVWTTPMLRRVVASTFAVHLLYGAAFAAEPLYVRDVLEQPASTFAALMTVFGIFLVLSGLVVVRLEDRVATIGWVSFGVAASGVAGVLYMGTSSVVVAFVGSAVWGVFTAFLGGPTRTLLQRHAAERLHGRVMATDFVVGSSAELLGIGISGVLIAAFGVRSTISLLAIVVVGIAAAIHRGGRREARRGVGPGDRPGGSTQEPTDIDPVRA